MNLRLDFRRRQLRAGMMRPACAGLLLFVAGVLSACLSTKGQAPNILLIVIDTLRADRLGCYGNERGLTPFLDSLGARGTVFVNAYAPSSWTCPSVASLMTSRYPMQHRVVSFASKLADEERTLAETLQPSGYLAGGFSANFRLLEALGYAQGFQHWRADLKHDGGLRGGDLRRQSMEWLDQARRSAPGQPILLYLHYMEPHAPYDPPEPFRQQFLRKDDGALDAATANEYLVGLRWYKLTHPDVEMLASLYDAEVASADAELRSLFAELEQRDFLRNAIVVVTADHGEEFWEHGNLSHGTSLYNESVRVPLLLIAPGYAGGRRVEQNVSLVDVAPTLLDLLGLPREPRFEGRSLVPLLRPQSLGARFKAWRRLGGRADAPDVLLDLESVGYGVDAREHGQGLVRESTKLLLRPGGLPEVYDLERDPLEKSANPDALQAQSSALREALEASRADLGSRAGAAAETAPFDDATREKLRALGYHF
jgi:arylsulfatase A-like enzyme